MPRTTARACMVASAMLTFPRGSVMAFLSDSAGAPVVDRVCDGGGERSSRQERAASGWSPAARTASKSDLAPACPVNPPSTAISAPERYRDSSLIR